MLWLAVFGVRNQFMAAAFFIDLREGIQLAACWLQGGAGLGLRHQAFMLLVSVGTAVATVYFYKKIDKGFFPQQDTA